MDNKKNFNNFKTVIILCTLPNDQDIALKLTKALLTNKLAACITWLNGAKSFYYWNGLLETHIELQLLIKTKESFEKAVFDTIKEMHPYTTPEILTVPITSGESNYLKWIHSTLESRST